MNYEVPEMLDAFSAYWHVLIVSTFLLVIVISFVVKFVIPGCRLRKELSATLEALRKINARSSRSVVELDEVAREAMAPERLAHLWREYTETLHPQKEKDAIGQITIVRWRATALAESFFTAQVLVDTPLKTEFYKHLPGILTGLGIIGTFSGLILGLSQFDPTKADRQLAQLINSVGNAFIVSATAIALAMLFTWIEKSLVTARYKQVEDLCQLIDSFFHAGVSEEYLERLVKASEASATQAAQIKDSLVTDLKQILSDLTTQQIEASARHARQMSVDVGKAIALSLDAPMEKISNAVERVGAEQGKAVNEMLAEVLVKFSLQMEEMFGKQMQGMCELLQKTSQVVMTTADKFEQLSRNVGEASRETSQSLKMSVASLSTATNKAIKDMNSGAATLGIATSDFAKAGQSVAETIAALRTASETLHAAAQALSLANSATQQMLQDYGKTRDVFALMVSELKSTIENAKKDASMTTGLVEQLKAASAQLGIAQQQSEEYLKGVTEVLAEAHQAFADTIGNTLRRGNAEFHQQLKEAVSTLSGSIMDLSNMLDDWPSKRRGGPGNSDSVVSGSLASPKPPGGGEPEERGDEENPTESRGDV